MWTKDITIWCDDQSCSEWFMGDAIYPRTVKQARRQAARAGWVFDGSRDLCPKHRREVIL